MPENVLFSEQEIGKCWDIFLVLSFMCVRAMRPRDPVLNVGLNNKININIPVGTDQLNVAINRVSCAAQCAAAELLLEWIETVNLKTVEA